MKTIRALALPRDKAPLAQALTAALKLISLAFTLACSIPDSANPNRDNKGSYIS